MDEDGESGAIDVETTVEALEVITTWLAAEFCRSATDPVAMLRRFNAAMADQQQQVLEHLADFAEEQDDEMIEHARHIHQELGRLTDAIRALAARRAR